MFRCVRVLTLICAATGGAMCMAEDSPADHLFHGGRIYTMNPQMPRADAVAVRGDTIVFVGNESGAQAFVGSETRIHDLSGQMLLPGFIDSHMHVASTLPYFFAAQLTPDMSAQEVIDTLRVHGEEHPEQNPVLGTGFLGAAFGPDGPTSADLDAAIADRPAIIFDEGFHSAWINSIAMEQVGLTADTPDPIPGAHYYRRYPDGQPTGWLIESESFGWIAEALGLVGEDVLEEAADAFLGSMSAMGLTGAFDAGIIEGAGVLFPFMGRRATEGRLPLRIVGSHYVNSSKSLESALADLAGLSAEYDHEMFDVEVLKISLDGTVEAQTAYMLEPYLYPAGHMANPLVPLGETRAVMAQAVADSIDIHLHAIGDAAVRMALDLVEFSRNAHPSSTSRFTVCHAQVVSPEDILRFGELGVIVQSTPTWYEYDEIALAYLGDERLGHMYPLRSIAAGGARVTLGSDFPASWMGLNGLSPLYNIEMGVTRQPPGDADFLPQPPADERITLEQALRGYTIDAAYQLGLEDLVGSIEAGKQADLVVLGNDLFGLDSYAIHRTEVRMTMVNGRIVFDGTTP